MKTRLFQKKFVYILIIATAFVLGYYISQTRAVSFSLDNPFRVEAFERLLVSQAEPAHEILILGDLESQILPCDCFIRPNGGFERLVNWFKASESLEQQNSPVVSLGGFWTESLMLDEQKKLKLEIIAKFLKSSKFDAILLSDQDLKFFRSMIQSEGAQSFKNYVQNLAHLPWVLPADAREPELYKDLTTRTSLESTKGALIFAGLTAASDQAKAEISALVNGLANEQKTFVVLSSIGYSDLEPLAEALKPHKVLFLSSTSDFGEATPLSYGSVLGVWAEKRSRSFAKLTLWDGVPELGTASEWSKLESLKTLAMEWDDLIHELRGLWGDGVSLKDMQVKLNSTEDEALLDIKERLQALNSRVPDFKKTRFRFDLRSEEIKSKFEGKNELTEDLEVLKALGAQ